MKQAAKPPAEDTLLDPRLLRLLDLLYRTRSVTKAAEALGLSQPTLSIWLGQARRRLDDPLFVRTPAGMEPTPRTEALIGTVRAALELLREVVSTRQAFDPASAERTFRICMTDASHVTLLPVLLAHLRTVAPRVRLVAARIDEQTAQALQSGDADLAIGFVPWLEAGFYQQTLYPQDWVCVAHPRHPSIGKTLTLRRYAEQGHVGIVGGTGAAILAEAVARARVSRQVMLELPGFLGLAPIVASTDLIATVPRHIGETLAAANGLTVCECPFSIPTFTVKQHWHARLHHDAANQWLRGVCQQLFQSDAVRRGERASARGIRKDRTRARRPPADPPGTL
jgi:DNA-binding transcriptional LysR family regulator